MLISSFLPSRLGPLGRYRCDLVLGPFGPGLSGQVSYIVRYASPAWSSTFRCGSYSVWAAPHHWKHRFCRDGIFDQADPPDQISSLDFPPS